MHCKSARLDGSGVDATSSPAKSPGDEVGLDGAELKTCKVIVLALQGIKLGSRTSRLRPVSLFL